MNVYFVFIYDVSLKFKENLLKIYEIGFLFKAVFHI